MEEIDATIERVKKLIELDASVELREYINDMNISDVAELINELPTHTLNFFSS
jgi:Mg/Co/Ni transporter MgtE